jgi:hypothetical protein
MPCVAEPGGKKLTQSTTLHRIVLRFARVTINTRLIAIVLTLAVPLNVVVVVVMWRLANAADDAQRASLLYAARSIATAVDAELGKYVALGQVLSHDAALRNDNLDTFDDDLRRKIVSVPNAFAVIADLEGRQLLNTGEPQGQPLPLRPAEAIAAQKQAFETRLIVISDVYQEVLSRTWMASANIPIFRNGEPFRSLALMMDIGGFADLLAFQDLPKNWLAVIRDGHGRLVARAPDNERWVGQLASEKFLTVKNRDGLFELTSRDGVAFLIANTHSNLSGWTIGVGVKTAELRAAVFSAVGWAVALGGAISLLSLIFAIRIAKRITGPLAELRQKAGALLADPRV